VPTGIETISAISLYEKSWRSARMTTILKSTGTRSSAATTSSDRSLEKKSPSGSWSARICSDDTRRSETNSSGGVSATAFSFTRRRYLLMNVFVRILKSQAFTFVPRSNLSKKRYAFRYVSWTRSSASFADRV
jgi:hypothetical protein